MTTSQITSFLSSISSELHPIPEGKFAYLQERQKMRIHEKILDEFLRSGITRAELAARMGKRPEQITRWLGAPSNWTLDTVSDLIFAISGSEVEFSIVPIMGRGQRNYLGPKWLLEKAATPDLVTTQQTTSIMLTGGEENLPASTSSNVTAVFS